MKTLLLVILLSLAVAGCAPDPRNQADADRTRLIAQAEAAASAQALAQNQQTYTLKIAQDQANNEAWVQSRNVFISVVMFALTFGAVGLILSVSVGGSIAAVQMGIATGNAALLTARQIPVNPNTFTLPALASPDGRYILEMNTGANYPTDQAGEPIPVMVESYRSRAEIALENYQAAHAVLNGKIEVTKTIDA